MRSNPGTIKSHLGNIKKPDIFSTGLYVREFIWYISDISEGKEPSDQKWNLLMVNCTVNLFTCNKENNGRAVLIPYFSLKAWKLALACFIPSKSPALCSFCMVFWKFFISGSNNFSFMALSC